MYSYIKGRIEYKATDYFVMDNNGMGYKIFSSLSTIDKLEIGQEAKAYTYMYVREDLICLYGFSSPEELRVFELLISVSGIGPKVASAVLSSLSPSKFGLALITGDVQVLKSVPGIGLKTAQRMILELKDKMKTNEVLDVPQVEICNSNDSVSEAINALQVLGYSAVEAMKVLKSIDVNNLGVEDIIKQSLKNLSR